MKKTILNVLICFSIFFAGCAGREANPVPVYLPGDEKRSCEGLKAEIAQLQVDMARLLPKTDKGLTNTLWAVGGVVAIVPFFFMDLKDAEKIEFDAMRRRHNRLLVYAAEKGCDMSGVRAEKIPSAEESKKANTESSKNLSEKYVPVGDELVYDDATRKGSISVQGKGLEARSWMIEKIGEIASSKNIRIKAGTNPKAGYYRVTDEKIQDGKYTIEFEIIP